ncbi:DNA transposase THAP9 [Dissostichus eleginoides]|uniref:DNA transposase THAP9 n=1 Tax=Dissostichus eleginoides TaxID=100907 RepID=A0AAD9F3Y5_DISEL|nr:DNA transposase THAP9 [Dissostichus eleginoides]KAK1903316.1 DNA transposase THAP9 [Dissostichus eleginoides]
MLKLIRNTLADRSTLQTPTGKISWKFLQELNKLQDAQGLRLGNKLKMAHIRWEKQKMKVKLATQVFSSSVADALEFCNTQLHLPQFRGCEETVEFLRTIDAAFDVLNSRNPLGKGYKAPMRTSNKERAEKVLL